MGRKLVSRSHRGIIKRLSCFFLGHDWVFQRKGKHDGLYLSESRLMCIRCGRCEWWKEDEEWKRISTDGIPSSPLWVYVYGINSGQVYSWFTGSHFFDSTQTKLLSDVECWRPAYPNPIIDLLESK